MTALFSKMFCHRPLKCKEVFRTSLLIFLLMSAVPSLGLAVDISAYFDKGVLKVDWGAPPIPNGRWRISITHNTTEVLRLCGPGVAGWGICGGAIDASGHFEKDFTTEMLNGGYIEDYQLTVNVEAMYESGSPSGITGSFSGYLKTLPINMKMVGDTNNQTGRIGAYLKNPLKVKLTRFEQDVTFIPTAMVSWSIGTIPPGAFGHFLGTETGITSEVHQGFKLGSLEGNYYVNAVCASCDNSQGMTLHFREAAAPITLAVKAEPPEIWPAGTSGSPKESTISITATDGLEGDFGPISGYSISIGAVPKQSHGHNHLGVHPNPGTLSETSCTIHNGICEIVYTSSEVAGINTIKAQSADSQDEDDITVRVPDLVTMGMTPPQGLEAGTIYPGMGAPERVWVVGDTLTAHQDPFYANERVVGAFQSVALNFLADCQRWEATIHGQIGCSLPILKEASLVNGGLYDLGSNWLPPHDKHREGYEIIIAAVLERSRPGQPRIPEGERHPPMPLDMREFRELIDRDFKLIPQGAWLELVYIGQ